MGYEPRRLTGTVKQMMRVSGWVSGVVFAAVLGVVPPVHAASVLVADVSWTVSGAACTEETATTAACESQFTLFYYWLDLFGDLDPAIEPPSVISAQLLVGFQGLSGIEWEGPFVEVDPPDTQLWEVLFPWGTQILSLVSQPVVHQGVPDVAQITIAFRLGDADHTLSSDLLVASEGLFEPDGQPAPFGLTYGFIYSPEGLPVSVPEPSSLYLSTAGLLIILSGFWVVTVRQRLPSAVRATPASDRRS